VCTNANKARKTGQAKSPCAPQSTDDHRPLCGEESRIPAAWRTKLDALVRRQRGGDGAKAAPETDQTDPGRTPEADAAVALFENGLRPVPLTPVGKLIWRSGRGNVESDGKDPIGSDWAATTYQDEEDLREVFRSHPAPASALRSGPRPTVEPVRSTLRSMIPKPRHPPSPRYSALPVRP
jgi:hypothetical protein